MPILRVISPKAASSPTASCAADSSLAGGAGTASGAGSHAGSRAPAEAQMGPVRTWVGMLYPGNASTLPVPVMGPAHISSVSRTILTIRTRLRCTPPSWRRACIVRSRAPRPSWPSRTRISRRPRCSRGSAPSFASEPRCRSRGTAAAGRP